MLHTAILVRLDLLFVSLPRRFDLIGFSHPKARHFLLLRQKKVSKEKATRMPLASCALGFFVGVCQKGHPCPFGKTRLPCRAPSGYSRQKPQCSARHTGINRYLRNISYIFLRTCSRSNQEQSQESQVHHMQA
jgi:hypothetical protein